GKEKKSFGIVGIIRSVFLIKRGPLKKEWLVHEINREAFATFQPPDLSVNAFGSQRKIQRQSKQLQFREAPVDARIKRRDDANLMAGARQILCQRANHIGEAAGF